MTSDHQRVLELVGGLLDDVGRNLDEWTTHGDQRAGRDAQGDLDLVIRYLRDIHHWLLAALVIGDPQYRMTDPPAAPGRTVEADRGPGWRP